MALYCRIRASLQFRVQCAPCFFNEVSQMKCGHLGFSSRRYLQEFSSTCHSYEETREQSAACDWVAFQFHLLSRMSTLKRCGWLLYTRFANLVSSCAPAHEERVIAVREEPSLHVEFLQRGVADGTRSSWRSQEFSGGVLKLLGNSETLRSL